MRFSKLYTVLFCFVVVAKVGYSQDLTSVLVEYEKTKSLEKPSDAIEQLEVLLESSKRLELDTLTIEIKKDLAAMYFKNSMDNEGLRMYFQLTNTFKKSQDYDALYDIYIELSEYYEYKEFPNNAADYRLNALNLADSAQLNFDRALLSYNIGRQELAAMDYENALQFLNTSDSLCVEEQRQDLLLQVLRLKARVFEKTNELDDAVVVDERILSLLDKNSSRSDYTKQLNNLGFIELKRGNREKALKYFLQTDRKSVV